jgi:LCP family protein required for cell wall assembly
LKLYKKKYVTDHQLETYLFLGTDASGNEEDTGDDYRGSMADFLNLLIVDRTEQTYSILALNRETMTKIHLLDRKGEGEATANIQLCTAHWYGGNKEMGCENTVTAVSDLLGGLPIDHYYSLPMEAIAEVNHLIGGVTVTIDNNDLQVLDPELTEGATVTLSDEQAYNFVHARMNVGDGENLSRMARQRQYLTAMIAQMEERMATDMDFGINVYDELTEYATTDITGKTVSRLANKVGQYKNRGIYEFEGTTELGQALGDGLDHSEFYPDEDSVIEVLTDLLSLEPLQQ